VKDYLKAIGKVPLLNAEMEVALAKRIEAGQLAEQVQNARSAPDINVYLAQMKARLHERKDHMSPTSHQKILANSQNIQEVVGRLANLGSLDDDALEWIAEDGKQALNHLQEANLRLVVSIAKRYTGRGMLFMDLIQEGNLGLRHAAEMFDYAKGYKFSTYATWWIQQSITRAMANQARTVRLPVHLHEVINQLRKTSIAMEIRLGREPTDEELAEELNSMALATDTSSKKKRSMTAKKIAEIKNHARDIVSLDKPVGDGGGAGRGQTEAAFGDLIEDKEVVMPADSAAFAMLRQNLQEVLDTLGEREAGIVSMRFGLSDGEPRTLDEIGEVYGVTRERIRQLESKAMAKLRHPSRAGRLEGYLD
jgi:RNA polymerase primary sigma factor